MSSIRDFFRFVRDMWYKWDIRGLVLLSFLIQVCLTISSPCRKRFRHFLFQALLWALYLGADGIALMAISKISTNISSNKSKGGDLPYDPDMFALWAPFLLLHLGGPDTITAFALEDNQLWLRHVLTMVMQMSVTIYVFVNSLNRHTSKSPVLLAKETFLFPTLLMFVDGFCKYWERIYALYNASADKFRKSLTVVPDDGPNLSLLVQEHASVSDAGIPVEFQNLELSDPLKETPRSKIKGGSDEQQTSTTTTEAETLVEVAFKYHKKFRRILADQQLSDKDSQEICSEFLEKPIKNHLRIVQIQLNFIYDEFYTKVVLLKSIWMRCSRAVAFFLAVGALLLFHIKDKKGHHNVDVGITYALLLGAVALDLVSALMFLTSDWMIALKHKSIIFKWVTNIWHYLAIKGLFPKRWSESICAYNVLEHCHKDLSKSNCEYPFKEKLVGWFRVNPVLVQGLDVFILKEIKQKAEHVAANSRGDTKDIREEICSARGDLITQDEYVLVSQYLRRWTHDIDFDESVVTWHIATSFCYYYYSKDTTSNNNNNETKFAKDLSDYMMYLLLWKRDLLSSVVGMSDVRYNYTYKDVNKFMKKWSKQIANDENFVINYSREVLEENTSVPPLLITPKDHESKSVYYEAIYLANQLIQLGSNQQWKIMAKVWVEMLCYAALRCGPRAHVAVLNRGGELITIVWLLMNHLGLTQNLSHERGLPWWVTLSVEK